MNAVQYIPFEAILSEHCFLLTECLILAGILTYVLLNTTGLQHPARIDRLDLLTTSGKLLESIPVKYYPDKIPYEIWNITEFTPPNEAFILRITGYDKDDYLFQRASSVSFSNIIPGNFRIFTHS